MISITLMWISLIIVMSIIELQYTGFFYFLSFSIGALIALLLDSLTMNIPIQFAGFTITSICAVMLLRFLIARYDAPLLETNMQALMGYKTRLIQAITENESGLIKIYGDMWAVKEKNGNLLKKGEKVMVVATEGCHLIVAQYTYLNTITE